MKCWSCGTNMYHNQIDCYACGSINTDPITPLGGLDELNEKPINNKKILKKLIKLEQEILKIKQLL